ncbi:MAG: serine/threonine-protein kinase [Chitinispirillaceae bacterium]|jgi:serine/threonine protein kinase
MAFSLKDYSGIEKIGQGGMGMVYRATQISLNRSVVIKEIGPDLLKDASLIQRFENEAKSAASLDHDNIIRVYDFGEDNGSFYISMEYIDGPNLEQLLSWEPFPKEIGLMIVLHALKGLNFAHKQGIAHGDVKPDNILVSTTGRVKLTDFGISYINAHSGTLPAKGIVFLTPAYMPPEQAAEVEGQDSDDEITSETIPASLRPRLNTEIEEPDIRRDIWSAGVLLYRVLCDRLPFSGENVSQLAQSIGYEKETNLLQIVPSLPEDIAEGISACLIKEPQNRLSTLEPIIESIQNYLFDMGFRDIEKEIEKYLIDRFAATAELEKVLISYHIRKGENNLGLGNELKSAAHFEEAEKINANDKAASTMEDPAVPSPALNAKTIRIPVVNQRRPAPHKKNKLFKTLAQVVAILLITFLGGVGSFAAVRKILQSSTTFSPSLLLAWVHQKAAQLSPVRSPPTGIADSPAESGHTAVPSLAVDPPPVSVADPPSVSVDSTPRPQDTAVKESPKKNKNTGPGTGQPVKKPSAPQTGTLKISVTPFPAKVYVDGDENISFEKLTRGVRLNPGPHVVTALADGYEPYQDGVMIEKDSIKTVSIDLKPLGKTSSILDIYCYPQSSIYVDGISRGFTPKTIMLSAGKHFLILQRNGYESYSEPVQVTTEKPTNLQIQLEKQ